MSRLAVAGTDDFTVEWCTRVHCAVCSETLDFNNKVLMNVAIQQSEALNWTGFSSHFVATFRRKCLCRSKPACDDVILSLAHFLNGLSLVSLVGVKLRLGEAWLVEGEGDFFH